MNFSYKHAPASIKLLTSTFLIFVALGYVLGLKNIHNNVGFSYTGVVVHYRGEGDDAMPPEFALAKLVHEHHVHLFSLSMLFFMVGGLFSFTSLKEPIKVLFIATPFLGMFLDFASLWLVALANPAFAFGTMVFGGFMAISFFMLLGRPLYEMWVIPVLEKIWGDKLHKIFE